MKTHPIFANKFAKFLIFIFCWFVLAKIFVWLFPPEHMPLKEPYRIDYFRVCIVENGKPKSIARMDLPSNPQFCQQELTNIVGINEMFYFHLKHIDNEWELIQYGDSMSDPWVYRYRIENNHVIPLWYTYGGGFILHMMAFTYALMFLVIGQAIVKAIIKRKSKAKNPT